MMLMNSGIPFGLGHDVKHVEIGNALDAGVPTVRANLQGICRGGLGIPELLIQTLCDFAIAQANLLSVINFEIIQESFKHIRDPHVLPHFLSLGGQGSLP